MPDQPTLRLHRTQVALTALSEAAAMARASDRQHARELCSAVLFEMQSSLAHNQVLLRVLLHALLIAHGFRLLSRLVLALAGWNVQFLLLAEQAGKIEPPRWHKGSRAMVCSIDQRWLVRLTANDYFLRCWCAALVAGQGVPSAATVVPAAPLSAGLV